VTPIEARDELYGMIQTTIAAAIVASVVVAIDVRWPGVSKPAEPPPTDDFYGRPQLTTIRDSQASLTNQESVSRYEAIQQLLFQVYSPISVAGASDQGLLLATLIRDAFRKPSTSGLISFTNQQVRQVGNNDTHYIINVIVTCTYDNIQ
jgi:hypothetical protein